MDWIKKVFAGAAAGREKAESVFLAKKNCLRTALCICAVAGWVGFLYPELTLPSDVCVVAEEQEGKESEAEITEIADRDALYWRILNADRSQIRIRSRLLERIGRRCKK